MQQFEGSLDFDGERLLLKFRWSKPRFQALTKLKGASYNKELKRWEVPLLHYPKLSSSRLFDPKLINYQLDPEAIKSKLSEALESRVAAAKRISENPFSVSITDIELTELDLVTFLAPNQLSLSARVKSRSRAKKILESLPGVHFLKKERAYFLPTSQLNYLLKALRDKELSFAVEAAAGAVLSKSAELRLNILSHPDQFSAEDLRSALLTPAIVRRESDSDDCFSLVGYTSEHLKTCFSHIEDYRSRIALARAFNSDELLRVLVNIQKGSHKIWLCKDTHSTLKYLDRSIDQSEALVTLRPPPISWIVGTDNHPGLLICEAEAKKLKDLFSKLKGKIKRSVYPHAPEFEFIHCIDSTFLTFFSEVSKTVDHSDIDQSLEFRERLLALRQREEQRQATEKYLRLSDIPVSELTSDDKLSQLCKALFPHQRVAVRWLLENPHAFLGDDMGLGKTLAVLSAYSLLKKAGENDLLVIACPNSLTRNWLREAKRWVPELMLHLIPQTKSDREKFFKQLHIFPHSAIDGIVVNYETLRVDSVFPEIKRYAETRKGFLCLDESQRVKNPQSKTFEALKELSSVFPRRTLLSGTPTPKDLSDIWGQMFILDRGARLGKSYYRWLGEVAELGNKWSEYAVKRFFPDQVEETVARVREVLLRRRKEDVINLPEKTFSIRDIDLIGDQRKRYDEVCEDLLIRVTRADGDTFVREINSILEEYLRAVQIASNPRLVDENWKGEPAKFSELDEIVTEVVKEREEKIVIWTNYRRNIEELTQRYQFLGSAAFYGDTDPKERQRIVTEFQEPSSRRINVLVAIPAAGGVGITLTAAQTAVYLDKSWNAEHWLQSVDRIHRIGQSGTVNIISLHAGGIDELISRSLKRKEKFQAKLLGDEALIEQLPSRDELISALSKS